MWKTMSETSSTKERALFDRLKWIEADWGGVGWIWVARKSRRFSLFALHSPLLRLCVRLPRFEQVVPSRRSFFLAFESSSFLCMYVQ